MIMLCKDCSLIIEEYNNLLNTVTDDDPITECWCDKYGCKIGYIGTCCEDDIMGDEYSYEYDDEYINNESECDELQLLNKSKRCKHERDKRYKQHLEHLADISRNHYPQPAWRVDHDNHYTRDINNTKYVKRSYAENHAPGDWGYYKHHANKAVRRFRGTIPNGCSYKKLYDLWWSVY